LTASCFSNSIQYNAGQHGHCSGAYWHVTLVTACLLKMSWALSVQDAGEVQQLRSALKQPGLLQAELEERAYALVLQQVSQLT
jgi:hypothetical protein